MKNKMILLSLCLALVFFISLFAFLITRNALWEAFTITVGVTLYHFLMRLAVESFVNGIMKNKADHNSAWFREKHFEKKLYRGLLVRRWKAFLPTYDPEAFDASRKTAKEILGATCQAEIVHEIIMLLSLLPIALIPLLGGAAVMIVTSVLSMLVDLLFVILQRYNRPRLVRVMERMEGLPLLSVGG